MNVMVYVYIIGINIMKTLRTGVNMIDQYFEISEKFSMLNGISSWWNGKEKTSTRDISYTHKNNFSHGIVIRFEY